MSNEWFELAWINFTKAILHGQYISDSGREVQLEQVLTDEQREKVYALNETHDAELRALLRSFVNERPTHD